MSRIVNFFDGAQSETTPTIGNIVASSLVKYASDSAYETNEQGAPSKGNIYFNTTSNLVRYYNGTEWIDFVDTKTTQIIENKTIDGSALGNNVVKTIASNVSVSPSGNLSSTNTQSALNELQGDIDSLDTRLDTAESDIVSLQTTKQNISQKGQANGYCDLDSNGLVPTSRIPGYVDDVLEYATFSAFPVTGESGKIYIDASSNAQYRWTGTIYVQLSNSPVTSVNGETGVVSLDLDDIVGVDLSTTPPVNGNALKFNGTNWVPGVASKGIDLKSTAAPTVGLSDGYEYFHGSSTSETTALIAANGHGVYDSGTSSWIASTGVVRTGTVQTLPSSGGTISMIAPKAQRQMVYVKGTTSGFTNSVNTIQTPNFIGQIIDILFDDSSSNYLTLTTGGNLKLSGGSQCNLKGISSISFICDNTNQWSEIARREGYRSGSTSVGLFTPAANNIYAQATANSITLPGTSSDMYNVVATGFFGNNATSPQYLAVEVGIYTANGNNTSTRPTLASDVDSLGSALEYTNRIDTSANGNAFMLSTRQGVFAGGQTLYVVQYAFANAITNARYTANIKYWKI